MYQLATLGIIVWHPFLNGTFPKDVLRQNALTSLQVYYTVYNWLSYLRRGSKSTPRLYGWCISCGLCWLFENQKRIFSVRSFQVPSSLEVRSLSLSFSKKKRISTKIPANQRHSERTSDLSAVKMWKLENPAVCDSSDSWVASNSSLECIALAANYSSV